uniref:Uncharacterized protein n=1 Tax=Arundo donax TaxID=35708 RepID=A0A0A8ZZF2_ARUDO
MFVKWCGESLR